MWWVLGDVVRAGDNVGRGTGWVMVAVLVLYGAVTAFVVTSWARWMVRRRRGIVRWGEPGPVRTSRITGPAASDAREREAG